MPAYDENGFAPPAPVARVILRLVFLNKTFRGRFFPVESEVGVIGRNVLNCVRLLLDGSALHWAELPPTSNDD